ncbi:hypothetical protein BCR39DRAFT_591012 [Naematelia encephala]|uniref:Myb-like domain-containing protein n=1 Tax=Naematelia encephala TaxID=71784 RepID=A0A1Y2AM04_9TREE|nr:hypothetical protein BCR39DRAFT_591012 [Naematelia encephala]
MSTSFYSNSSTSPKKRQATSSPPLSDDKPVTVFPTTPKKKSKVNGHSTTPKLTPGKNKGEGWTAEKRIKLFEAFVHVAAVDWNSVAVKMGDGTTGKMCREQWQRAMGKKIRKALMEE